MKLFSTLMVMLLVAFCAAAIPPWYTVLAGDDLDNEYATQPNFVTGTNMVIDDYLYKGGIRSTITFPVIGRFNPNVTTTLYYYDITGNIGLRTYLITIVYNG